MRIQRGARGSGPAPPPHWKVTSYMCFLEINILPPGKCWVSPPTPPPPNLLKNVGHPLDPWKSIVFSVIKPLDCKIRWG